MTAVNTRHAKRAIHSRTCVMILSDGYDTGPPEVLASAMRDLAALQADRLAQSADRPPWLRADRARHAGALPS